MKQPQPSSSFHLAVVAPTYNNARTLPGVLDALAGIRLPVIAVDDGCTDGSADLLRAWRAGDPALREVVTHTVNCGKAHAMQSGFARAASLGFTHALTIDTDGQHDVDDVLPLAKVASECPGSLVIGVRPTTIRGYPVGSRVGRFISNLLIALESGVRVADSQCGLRVYPLGPLSKIRTRAGRFGFETEVVTRFAWAGGTVHEMPIRCVYNVAGGRTSHFRPWRDSLSASVMHARLVTRALAPWPAPRTIARPAPDATVVTGTVIQRLGQWFNPLRTWRQVRASPVARRKLALGAATGAVVAAMPLYGLKTAVCLALAKVLRAPPLVLIASSSVLNTPPLGALVAATAIAMGHVLVTGHLPAPSQYDLSAAGFWTTFRQIGLEWLLGGAVLGAVLGGVVYAVVRLMTSRLPSPTRTPVSGHTGTPPPRIATTAA
jgi:uncharacterized protein (DUF2062 family)